MAIENLQPLTYAVIIFLFCLGTGSILVRLYCRICMLKTFGWDDVAALFLLLVNTIQQTILFMFLHYGSGKHVETLTNYQLQQLVNWLFVEEIFYMFTHWTIKHAFLLFYLRLSPSIVFRRCVIATMVLNTVFTLSNWMLACLQCIPFGAILHRALYPNAKCINPYILLMLPSILNIITDVIILVLPIRTVWGLQMSTRRKIGVLAVIGFGASAVVIALCRFVILKELGSNPDISYILGKMIIVASLEIQFAVISVNLPSMKSLMAKMTGGGTSHGESVPDTVSKGYKLSATHHWSKRSKARSEPDSITRHIGGIPTTGSEEELCGLELKKHDSGEIKVTKSIVVTSSSIEEIGEDEVRQESYYKF